MKILLLGGYGVFGSRLARLLVRDDHSVWIAGRNLKAAKTLADELGCQSCLFDRTEALETIAIYDVVIDAAGPFHSYGNDPYRLINAAIEHGVHYLDLSDNAAFCSGTTAFNAAAKAANVCVLSGLSSVPATSSAAVIALAGEDRPIAIESAILPGNRAPRGLSVMHSILAQAGRPMTVWRGGQWETHYGWSKPVDYSLPDGVVRQGWQIDVPDVHLFPEYFGADSVRFSAGLELGLMRYGLAAFAQLQRVLNLPVNMGTVRVFKVMADALAPFGSGRGGMSVTITTESEQRNWRLLAEDGDGPFIPAVPARALLRRSDLPIGAGPALGILTLEEAESAMSDLRVITEETIVPRHAIFPYVLGAEFQNLPAKIREMHQTVDCSYWEGRSEVIRGTGLWSRLIGACVGFPAADADTSVKVKKSLSRKGETWRRQFGPRVFKSFLSANSEGVTESFGPFTFQLGLEVKDQSIHFPVKSAKFGPFPMPRWLLPISQAREYVKDDTFRFDVKLYAPISRGLIVQYKGWLKPRENERTSHED